jgi:integrase
MLQVIEVAVGLHSRGRLQDGPLFPVPRRIRLRAFARVRNGREHPTVLTPEEIMAFLSELPDPLRTMIELDAFTGLRRGELIGLRWQDVDFENLVLHIRRSVVAMVEGAPKTEASLKDVPLDAQTAESLWAWKQSCPYPGPGDWIFASPHMKGRQPYWPGTLWRYYGKPALQRAKVTKRVSYHTLRHTFELC